MHDQAISWHAAWPAPRLSARRNPDRFIAITAWLGAIAVTTVFFWIVVDLIRLGGAQLTPAFITNAPTSAGRAGGIGSVLVSTALILGVCLAVSAPLGIATAILLAEFTREGNRYCTAIRRSLDTLAGVPSIVFGLFGYAFFCVYLRMGFSILSGGLTLACMVLPILTRTAEQGLRSVPDEYRYAAAAVGMTRTQTLRQLLLPAAMPGLVAGVVLGVGRALAETAALLYTSGYADRMPSSLADSGRSLSIHIYDLAMNVPGGEPNAYATALVLVGLLIAINATAVWLGERWTHRKLSTA